MTEHNACSVKIFKVKAGCFSVHQMWQNHASCLKLGASLISMAITLFYCPIKWLQFEGGINC